MIVFISFFLRRGFEMGAFLFCVLVGGLISAPLIAALRRRADRVARTRYSTIRRAY